MKTTYRRKQLIESRLKGYIKLPKAFFHPFSKDLSAAEHRFLMFCYGVLVDWDVRPTHRRVYGSFDNSNGDIGSMLLISDSAVSKLKTSLINKKYLYKRVDGRTAFMGFGLINKSPSIISPSRLHEIIRESHANNEKLLNYLEINQTLINIEYLEHHGLTPKSAYENDEDFYKAFIDSFKVNISDNSEVSDLEKGQNASDDFLLGKGVFDFDNINI